MILLSEYQFATASILLVTSHSIGAKVHRIETVITQALCALKTQTLWQSALQQRCRWSLHVDLCATTTEAALLMERVASLRERSQLTVGLGKGISGEDKMGVPL